MMHAQLKRAAAVCVLALLLLIPAAIRHTRQQAAGRLPTVSVRQAREDTPYIKIGVYASLTGYASQLGGMGQQGIRLAVEDVNSSGGIKGKEIRLIEYDDQTSGQAAVSAVQKMIEEDRVDAIIGSHTSGNIIQTSQLTEQAHILQIGLGTSYIWTDVGKKYLFRAVANSKYFDELLLSAMERQGGRRIGIFYSDTEYAESGAEHMVSLIAEQPEMELVWMKSHKIDQVDYTQVFTGLMYMNVDSLVLYTSSENAALQLRQLRQAGFQGEVYAPESFANSEVRRAAGTAAEGLVYACGNSIPDAPLEAVTSEERSFLIKFIRRYGTMPVAETAYRGYDALMILAEAMNRADSLESDDVLAALLSIDNYKGIGGTFDFTDGTGDGLRTARLFRVVNGKPALFTVKKQR
ncbi:MAG: ABC transporter substrate-binding protein [Eubacteriales bacterium]|nr:ABC transporter substrate-binding protein [Eubacteriales bacterium]